MTTPATYNIVTYQGDDDTFVMAYATGGSIANLTGYTAKMDVRTRKSASGTVASFSSAGGSIAIDGPHGKLTVAFPHTVTAALTPGDYVYDLQITSPTGAITTIVEGLFSVIQ